MEKGAPKESSSVVEMTRRQLYDEVWSISVAGVSRKYDIPYSQLLPQIREAGIPIPSGGYWTKLKLGKPTETISLEGPADEVVGLYRVRSRNAPKEPPKLSTESSPLEEKIRVQDAQEENQEQESDIQHKDEASSPELEAIAADISEKDIYNRGILYDEVWKRPLPDIADSYQISENSLDQMCSALCIPRPPANYWHKIRTGKSVPEKPPLFPTSLSTSEQIRNLRMNAEKLVPFLNEEDRKVVAAVASQIVLPAETSKMHSIIIAERKVRAQWRKDLENKPKDRWGRIKDPDPPDILMGEFSEDSEARIYRIIDALIKAMEPLGCELKPGMEFVVAGEKVNISFSEAQDKVNHILTKEENLQLVRYEEDRRRHSWASKPQIRKYDYFFNGKLTITIDGKRRFRDCASYVLEDRLGDVMISLYCASQDVRQRRIAAEEAERKRQEELKHREQLRDLYNTEVKKTIALENISADYEVACRIRNYIEAYRKTHQGADAEAFIAWAEAKADWYDPTVSAEDDFFGKRIHSASWDSKTPKPKGTYWF